MKLEFILGEPGTGKTTKILEEIREKLDNPENVPLYYLVPEQFSLQSEKLLLTNDVNAATSIQVLSFNRLAYRLFSVLGKPQGKFMDDLGKQMLVRKVLFDVQEDLTYYKSITGKLGFVEELVNSITEFNQYMVSKDDLIDRSVHSSKSLEAKLVDMSIILEKYRETTRGKYLLADDMLELLCDALSLNEEIPLLDNAYFWVDGFSGFTPQEEAVLSLILKRAKKITISLTVGEGFDTPIKTMERLMSCVGSAKSSQIKLEANKRQKNSPDLLHLVKNFNKKDKKDFVKSDENTNIEIIAAGDRYAAVYATAAEIQNLVNNQNHNFRDIAILCEDRGNYEKILQTVFDRLNIPIFIDTEIDILMHPLTETIRSLLEMIIKNYNYESVFRFLKSNLTGISKDIIDMLENYVLANGISSYKYRYEFTNEIAEEGRLELLKIIEPFSKIKSDTKSSVKDFAKLVYQFLFNLKIDETIKEWFETEMHAGNTELARIHGQIWQKINQVFDKLVEILGEEKITFKEFAETLDAGFLQVGLGRIPPTTNQVILGDVVRSRYPKIKTMIVLGANEGVIPKTPDTAGLFTDHERKILINSNLNLAPHNKFKLNEAMYNIYCAISQPEEKLILIYAESETSGKVLKPSIIVNKIKEMFPNILVKQAPKITEYAETFKTKEYPTKLNKTTIDILYSDNLITAATRLEAFAKCPFAYFMTYILEAKPREIYEVLPSDLGKIFHEVIANFTKKVYGKSEEQKPKTRDEINDVVNELINNIVLDTSIYKNSKRNNHILEKVRRVAAVSCWAITEHVKNDIYEPKKTEEKIQNKIQLENGKTITLKGQVDRVDFTNEEAETYVKIIDYKSGNTKFNPEEVRQGIQLQLMLYMDALIKSTKNAKPGGIYYFPIDDPIVQTDDYLNEAVLNDSVLKSFKQTGLNMLNEKNKEVYDDLSEEVKTKVNELGTNLINGYIAPKPYRGQKSPCEYCKYAGVCGKEA